MTPRLIAEPTLIEVLLSSVVTLALSLWGLRVTLRSLAEVAGR